MKLENRLEQVGKRMVGKVPRHVSYSYPKYRRVQIYFLVRKRRHFDAFSVKRGNRVLVRVVGVKLCDSELFLGSKLHHKNVEGVGHGSLAVGNLSADHLRERRKELVVVGPVTAGEFSVHEGHEGGWLVDI